MISHQTLTKTFCNKKVLITGHTGFKGSWLTYILKILKADIIGYALDEPENKNHVYHALDIKSLLINPENNLHNIVDFDTLQSVFEEYKPDFVFHLAAQAIVSQSYIDPLETIRTNIIGTTNVLEILRLLERKITALIITSDKCYKNKERVEPYKENEEMGGEDPYSASKGCAELLYHSYMKSYFEKDPNKHISSTRAGNVFGGGDWSPNRLIPDCVRDILTNGVVNIRMPEAIRPWTFVIEILYGYIMLAHKIYHNKNYQGSWNFASREMRTVAEVCTIFIDALGKGCINIDQKTVVGKESSLLLIDETKAREQLNWSPLYSVDDALKLTAQWYHSQSKGEDIKKLSHDFIMQYLKSIG